MKMDVEIINGFLDKSNNNMQLNKLEEDQLINSFDKNVQLDREEDKAADEKQKRIKLANIKKELAHKKDKKKKI